MYIKPSAPNLGQYVPAPPVPAAPPEPPRRKLVVHPLRSLRNHALAASVVALLIVGVGVAALLRDRPMYRAAVTLTVSPTLPRTMSDDSDKNWIYEQYVQDQIHNVTRYDVLAEALRQMPANLWRYPGETEQSAVGRLAAALDVRRIPATYEVQISISQPRPDSTAEIVNAVARAFVEKAKLAEFYGQDDRLASLREERGKIQSDLDSRLKEQAELARALGMAALPSTTSGATTMDTRTAALQSDYLAAHAARLQAEAQLDSLLHGDANAPSSALNSAADELVANDPSLSGLKASLSQKRATLAEQLGTMTPGNPIRKQTEAQLADIDSAIQSFQADLRRKAATRLEEKLRTELRRSTQVESRLMSDMQSSKTVASGAAPKLQRAQELAADIDRLQKRYAAVDERERNLELEVNSPSSVHVSTPAMTPLAPVRSKALLVAPAILPLALLCGLATAILMDLLDPHVYSPNDVDRILGFLPVGVLYDEREVTQLVFDEAHLRLAAGIDHAARRHGVRTFVVTGVNRGAGASTIVNTLGSTLARLGRKTLTIDASGHSNPVAYVTVGLNQVDRLSDFEREHMPRPVPATEPSSAAVVTQSLSKVTPLTNFMDQAFQDLTNDYDLVLIDATAILISAETEYLARFADVTMLVIESGRTRKRDLARTAALLERLNVNGVTAVLNKLSLARLDKHAREDMRLFEERISETKLRWKPGTRPAPATVYPFEGGAPVEEETPFVRHS